MANETPLQTYPPAKGFHWTALDRVSSTQDEPALPWTRADVAGLAVVLACAAGLFWQLWAPGVQGRADMLMGVYRIFELAAAWREGIYFPRLGLHLNFTYSAPLFQFYPPLVSYLGLLFYGLGLGYIGAAKATFAVSLPLAGCGMYLYARAVLRHRAAAWLSALLYVGAPYLLLDIYERGAAAETVALALLPWLLWALRGQLVRGEHRFFWLSAGLIAGLILTHNITALFVLPAAVAYVALVALYERKAIALAPITLAMILGLGLAAFYWLPAMREVKYTYAEQYMLGDASDVTQNLVAWREVVQPTFVMEYTGPLRFRFALQPLLFGLLGLLALPFLSRRPRFEGGLLAGAWLAVLFLQTEQSLFFWQGMPLVRFIQFSWRLYGLAALSTALLAGAVIAVLPFRLVWGWTVAVGLVLVALWSSTARLDPQRLTNWYLIDEAGIHLQDLYERGRADYPLFGDYQPLVMQTSPRMLSMPQSDEREQPTPVTPPPQMQVLSENPVHVRLAIDAAEPFTLRFHRIFFPGWQVYAGDQPVPTAPSGKLGLVTAQLPAGAYEAVIQFGQTPIRRMGDWFSVLSLAVAGAGLVGRRRPWLAAATGLSLAVLTAALILYVQGPGRPSRQPTPAVVNFQDELHLLSYHLEKTNWRPGDEIPVRLYWWAAQAPQVNYKLFLHLAELDDSGKVAQLDTEPMMGFSPTTRWESGELVVDELRLPLDSEVKPGRYRLLVGVYHPETVQNLAVLSGGEVLPGDRVALTEVEILNE
ncbi:MAG: hypothetical protein DCC55_02465 [Chloroflexi bacterium]|nr:MAG: hypothetical protein DCC55_02465 [Chloroflexota bacterium]